jgi:hypothetical protein
MPSRCPLHTSAAKTAPAIGRRSSASRPRFASRAYRAASARTAPTIAPTAPAVCVAGNSNMAQSKIATSPTIAVAVPGAGRRRCDMSSGTVSTTVVIR